jgi:hypothetical protein
MVALSGNFDQQVLSLRSSAIALLDVLERYQDQLATATLGDPTSWESGEPPFNLELQVDDPFDQALAEFESSAEELHVVLAEQPEDTIRDGRDGILDRLLALATTQYIMAGAMGQTLTLDFDRGMAEEAIDEMTAGLLGLSASGGALSVDAKANCDAIVDGSSEEIVETFTDLLVPSAARHFHSLARELIAHAEHVRLFQGASDLWHRISGAIRECLHRAKSWLMQLVDRGGIAVLDVEATLLETGKMVWEQKRERLLRRFKSRVTAAVSQFLSGRTVLDVDGVVSVCEGCLVGLDDAERARRKAAIDGVAAGHRNRMRYIKWSRWGLRVSKAPLTACAGPAPTLIGAAALVLVTFWLTQDALDSNKPFRLPDLIRGVVTEAS